MYVLAPLLDTASCFKRSPFRVGFVNFEVKHSLADEAKFALPLMALATNVCSCGLYKDFPIDEKRNNFAHCVPLYNLNFVLREWTKHECPGVLELVCFAHLCLHLSGHEVCKHAMADVGSDLTSVLGDLESNLGALENRCRWG